MNFSDDFNQGALSVKNLRYKASFAANSGAIGKTDNAVVVVFGLSPQGRKFIFDAVDKNY